MSAADGGEDGFSGDHGDDAAAAGVGVGSGADGADDGSDRLRLVLMVGTMVMVGW